MKLAPLVAPVVALLVALPVTLLWGCSTAEDGPRLAAVVPGSARVGAIVTLSGSRLCGGNCSTAGGEVQFGLELPTHLARIVAYSDTSADVEVPAMLAPGRTEIVVTVNESASNAVAFEVLP